MGDEGQVLGTGVERERDEEGERERDILVFDSEQKLLLATLA